MRRDVCSLAISKQPKLLGTVSIPIQINESYFSGKRKYNRGRVLSFDKSLTKDLLPDWNEEDPESTTEEPLPTSRRNYGNLINGPWVVGLYQ